MFVFTRRAVGQPHERSTFRFQQQKSKIVSSRRNHRSARNLEELISRLPISKLFQGFAVFGDDPRIAAPQKRAGIAVADGVASESFSFHRIWKKRQRSRLTALAESLVWRIASLATNKEKQRIKLSAFSPSLLEGLGWRPLPPPTLQIPSIRACSVPLLSLSGQANPRLRED